MPLEEAGLFERAAITAGTVELEEHSPAERARRAHAIRESCDGDSSDPGLVGRRVEEPNRGRSALVPEGSSTGLPAAGVHESLHSVRDRSQEAA